ncbi:MAG: Uma2 family endonuclease [Anaerolineae bacterium]
MSVRMHPPVLDVEPAWDIAKIFPAQGTWAEEDYLLLPGNRLVEYSHGIVEVLSMPSYAHQLVTAWLYEMLKAFVRTRSLGVVVFAPLRVKLWAGKYREPDLLFMFQHNRRRIHPQYWEGADLVMEVVSRDDPLPRPGNQAPRVCPGWDPRVLAGQPTGRDDHSLHPARRCVGLRHSWRLRPQQHSRVSAPARLHRGRGRLFR